MTSIAQYVTKTQELNHHRVHRVFYQPTALLFSYALTLYERWTKEKGGCRTAPALFFIIYLPFLTAAATRFGTRGSKGSGIILSTLNFFTLFAIASAARTKILGSN